MKLIDCGDCDRPDCGNCPFSFREGTWKYTPEKEASARYYCDAGCLRTGPTKGSTCLLHSLPWRRS